MWRPQIAALADDFRVVAVDLPGYGESPARGPAMTMSALADTVLETLDALKIDRAVVVGLSMGGLVAMELGLRHPHRVAGLVLAATTAEPVAPGEVQAREELAQLAEDRGMLPLAADMIATLFGPASERDHALVVETFEMMLGTSTAGAAAALRGRAQRPDYSQLLRNLAVPATIVAGDRDPHSPDAVVDQLVGALPGAALHRFEGSGHMPNLEQPARFNALVRQFAVQLGGTRR